MTTAVPPGKRQATSPAPTSQPQQKALVSVRVWDAPLRLMHWALVLSIGVLSVTGVYLTHPFLSPATGQGPGEPATAFTMGTMRAVHITAGWVFTVVLLARIGWAFRGNRWARWDQLLPVHRYRRALLRPSIEYYTFRRLEAPPVIGHNPLAGLTYVVLFLMFAYQAFTGFALEALVNPGGLTWTLTGWIFRFVPIPDVRLSHYLVMWLTWGFIIHHVYSAWLVDREEHSGEISSIISGWKNLPRSRVENAPELTPRRPR
jgi:Ni/Fe-hydrogenase 1 B-type cytochrome subunit